MARRPLARRLARQGAELALRLVAVFLTAGLCSFLTIYRPVLRAIYDALESYAAFVAGVGTAWQDVGPFVLADYTSSMLALGAALALALAIGLPAGLLAGTRRASPLAAIIRLASSLGSMMPAFLLALAIMVFFVLYVLPLTGVRFILLSSQEPTTDPRRLLPIALTLAVRPLAYFTAVTEAATRDTLAADYIRTARAKGLPELLVLARHVLPHVLVTLVGAVPAALLFSVSTLPIVEFVFSWPGVGQELLYRIVASPEASPRTAALVAFLLASIGGTYVLVALLAETARRLLDPRAHLAER